MRFSLISLAAFGMAAAALIAYKQASDVDFNEITGSLTAADSFFAGTDVNRTNRLQSQSPTVAPADQRAGRTPATGNCTITADCPGFGAECADFAAVPESVSDAAASTSAVEAGHSAVSLGSAGR